MVYKISSQDLGRIRLNESDVVSSILQNIAIILSTRKQSVPLYRQFGLPADFIDKPVSVVKPLMISEIQQAITEFEPRAILRNVTFTGDEAAPEKLVPIVEVEIVE